MKRIVLQEKLKSVFDLEFIGLKFDTDIKNEYYDESLFYIIGNDYEDKIGLKDSNNEVFSISTEEIIFINSSLEQLLDFITLFNEIIDLDDEYDENMRSENVRTISIMFKEIDQFALQDNSWWRYILEQVEDGLI